MLWLSLSREGLWGAWNILAKATLGAGASIVLAGTTQVPDLLLGFERLKMPRVLVSITHTDDHAAATALALGHAKQK